MRQQKPFLIAGLNDSTSGKRLVLGRLRGDCPDAFKEMDMTKFTSKVKMPEPAAYLRSDDLKKLSSARVEGGMSTGSVYGAMHIRAIATKELAEQYGNNAAVITVEQAEAYANERVKEALEDAAQEANDWSMQYVEVDTAPRRVGDYIRALIPNDTE